MRSSFRQRVFYAAAAAIGLFGALGTSARCESNDVARATLGNGLRVVVVRNTLAPVVTTVLNYESGSDEQWIPGLAHATEHMMFRGSRTLSSSALMDSIGITGGDLDADTTSTVTQYFFTVPSQFLDIALRAERSRATGVLMSQALWNQERGAITQEVQQDNSNAFYRLFVKMQNRIIGGTPYAKNTLGTVGDFAHSVNSTQLRRFYNQWYHPDNAIYVITGNVDPAQTIARVRSLFGDVPSVKLPARAVVHLTPLHPALYRDTSDQAFTGVAFGYRFPGYNSPDYAAGQILSDVLSSQRSDFGGLPFTGKALATQFFTQDYPKVAIGIAFAAVPVTVAPETIAGEMRTIIENYKKTGIPADLVEAAKLREISQLEFSGNSIEGQAFEWSQAVAVQGLSSPDDMISQFERVSAADVTAVLRKYVDNHNAVTIYAVPKNTGTTSAGGEMAKENNEIPPTTHEPLPDWAKRVLQNLSVPEQTISPADVTLSNGMRLIVQPVHNTRTVVVDGEIDSNPQMQEPAGQEGVRDVTDALFPYGTTTYDRVGLQTELDKIAATTQAGTDFGLNVLSAHFERGVELLADEQLHPALHAADFGIVQSQLAGALTGEMTSPDHLSEVALNKALYPAGDPAQRFATPKSVSSLTLDDVKRWYATSYRPDMTTVVVIGDTTPEAARAIFERYFGAWKAVGPKPNVDFPAVPLSGIAQVHVPATGRVQSTVRLVQTLGLVRSDPGWAQLQVANTVLTGGFYTSLLYHDLREIHGYAYSIQSQIRAGRTRSTFGLDYGCDPKNIVPAESQITAILDGLTREPIAEDRLLRSKALLMGEVPIREASYDGVTAQLLDYAHLGLPLDQNLIDARAELSATAQSVQEAIQKYVRPNAFVRVVTGPGPG
ncbi:MAG TPA: pitrilysin family protein [Candidatus Cybelea sp.]|jgi:zinc protease